MARATPKGKDSKPTKSKAATSSNGKKKQQPKKKQTAGKRARLGSDELDESSEEDHDEGSAFEDEEAEGSSVASGSVAVEESESDLEEEDEDASEEEDDAVTESGGKKRKSSGESGGGSGKKVKGDKNTRVVKRIVKIAAPKGNAETKVILPTTLEFLGEVRDHNHDEDARGWFKDNDARYRHALLNFNTMLLAWVPLATDADWSLPHMPIKDLTHRIYRDVRFSKEKTPYKPYLSASHSRTGRKGAFSLYYLQIGDGNSMLAAGLWQPSGDALKTLRAAIIADSSPLRKILADETFKAFFGEPDAKKGRTSIFGQEDQLKNCPKIEGVTKDHPEIDLLKCRSFAVSHKFSNEEVLDPDFLEKTVKPVMETLAPFVQQLNEWLFPTPPEEDEGEGGSAAGGEEEEEDEDEDEDEDEE